VSQTPETQSDAVIVNSFGKTMVPFYGFFVMREILSRCKRQLLAVARQSRIQKQFIGTMLDTEVASGYFIGRNNVSGDTWVSYVGVKMKYPGDLVYMARLVSHPSPSRGWYANSIKQSRDRRWSLNLQGVVAYALLHEARPYLHNEKTVIEVDCILKHGPSVDGKRPHPFVQCGARHVRRGVWYWPQIDDENDSG
jgi:hypothetical protein